MKKIKLLTIILAIVLVTMVSFFGVYVQVQNRMENQVEGYEYAMDLKGARNIRLTVDTTVDTVIKDAEGNEVTDADDLTNEELTEQGYTKEETPYNKEEVLNKENYKKSKEIIEKRLNSLGVDNYVLKLDEATGDILIEVPENSSTDSIVSNIGTTGKFEIIDSETEEVLMDNSDIKRARVMYGTNSTTGSGTSVYLEIEFDKEGKEKLKEITNTYVETTTTTEETNVTEDNSTEVDDTASEETTETTTKEITMKIDDEEIMTTSFDETIENGKLQLSIGSSTTDTETLQSYVAQATSVAVILDNENTPVRYTVSANEYILSDITQENLMVVLYVIIALVVIALVVLVIRYRTEGLLNSISYIGLISLFLLLLRYTNVIISIESIFGIVVILILNYIFVNKLLLKLKKNEENSKPTINEAVKESYKEFFIKIIPICIAVITFCFIQWEAISTFGMVMFWGISLIALYNITITNLLIRIKESKGGKNRNGRKQK